MALADTFAAYREEFVQAASDSPFVVFLCGPSLKLATPPANLRRALKDSLEQEKFEVVLGEDEGLDDPQLRAIGINAQDNELEFIRSRCGAIVIVADSVGSLCELALFSWHLVHDDGVIDSRFTDCIVLVGQQYQPQKSYFNLGPIAAVNAFGRVEYVDFSSYDSASLIARLRDRRGIMTVDRRGRPKKAKP